MDRYGWQFWGRPPRESYGNRDRFAEPFGGRYGASYGPAGYDRGFRGGREHRFDRGLEEYYSGTYHTRGPIGQSSSRPGWVTRPEHQEIARRGRGGRSR
jgi:hypothetical protein